MANETPNGGENFSGIIPQMLGAAEGVLRGKWPEVREYAETEFKKFAETLALIARLRAEGKIDEKRARLHIKHQEAAMRNVFITIKGLSRLAAEQAINAAIGVVRDTVNRTIGFGLL